MNFRYRKLRSNSMAYPSSTVSRHSRSNIGYKINREKMLPDLQSIDNINDPVRFHHFALFA